MALTNPLAVLALIVTPPTNYDVMYNRMLSGMRVIPLMMKV